MNRKLTTAGATLSASSYVSPKTNVTEIHSEGVLCASDADAILSVTPWEDGEFKW